MQITPRDIESLIELFDSSEWDEMHLSVGGVEIFLSTDPGARIARDESPAALMPAKHAPAPTSSPVVRGSIDKTSNTIPDKWIAVRAPNLGTFYRAPKPGAAPFVEVGATVEKDTEICLIEVMKLFTTLTAGVRGTLRQVCVKDGVMVEHGDILFYIEPA